MGPPNRKQSPEKSSNVKDPEILIRKDQEILKDEAIIKT